MGFLFMNEMKYAKDYKMVMQKIPDKGAKSWKHIVGIW